MRKCFAVLFFFTLLCFASCFLDPGVKLRFSGFDRALYEENKNKWDNSSQSNYSFDYRVASGAGTTVEGHTTVKNAENETIITKIFNMDANSLSENERTEDIEEIKRRGYYFDDVDAIFRCILKLYNGGISEGIDARGNKVVSHVSVYVEYNRYGVPVFIELSGDDYDGTTVGHCGLKVKINNFTLEE